MPNYSQLTDPLQQEGLFYYKSLEKRFDKEELRDMMAGTIAVGVVFICESLYIIKINY